MVSYDKILGCLVGGATGDAMGAATEIRSRHQIHECFGGDVKDFRKPPKDTYARGSEAGQITDDFSVAYVTARKVADNGGKVTKAVAKEALLEWSKVDKWFSRFAGPTTRANIAKMTKTKPNINMFDPANLFEPINQNAQSSNGAGMKIAPVSLFSNGDVDVAIKNAITVASLTHPNQIALSGSCAVAAATAQAMHDDADLFSVVQAGLYGAREGARLGLKYHENAGASVEERMKLAIYIGLTARNMDEAIDELAAKIGSSLAANEAIPAVFGLMVAAKGDTMQGIYGGVNIGDDTDTVATMVGGILGTLNGAKSLPKKNLKYLEKQNGIQLEKLAKDMDKILNKGK
ncbi:MAG: ADP-ribosylglycohydrolase family protein [Solobacterium sp.]|nr:ADP-ribosylglycohydrolase family protein [Solobacterium sp.]